MKTPFTPNFLQASIALTAVSRRPFVPMHPLPFVSDESTAYYVGDGCQLSYRWHDAFDVFVAVLEVYVADAENTTLAIPVASHLNDLHLVYQLAGSSNFYPPKATAIPILQLPIGHHLVAYSPPAAATLHIQPARQSRRFALVASVPKGKWAIRHNSTKPNALEGLLNCLRQKRADQRILLPSPISPQLRVWLYLLLTTPTHPGMLMDNAVHHMAAQLVEQHRTECAQPDPESQEYRLVESARQLVRTLVNRLDGDKLLTVKELAAVMHIRPKSLWKAHQRTHGSSLDRYINDQLMERAKSMLDAGMSVKITSLTLGYSSQNNFSRSFKNKYGISPTRYQQHN